MGFLFYFICLADKINKTLHQLILLPLVQFLYVTNDRCLVYMELFSFFRIKEQDKQECFARGSEKGIVVFRENLLGKAKGSLRWSVMTAVADGSRDDRMASLHSVDRKKFDGACVVEHRPSIQRRELSIASWKRYGNGFFLRYRLWLCHCV